MYDIEPEHVHVTIYRVSLVAYVYRCIAVLKQLPRLNKIVKYSNYWFKERRK